MCFHPEGWFIQVIMQRVIINFLMNYLMGVMNLELHVLVMRCLGLSNTMRRLTIGNLSCLLILRCIL